MSFVVNGLGSTPKRHLKQKKAYAASLDRDIKVFRKELRKGPRGCRTAGHALMNVGFAAGAAFSEMKGVSRKSSIAKKPTGAAVSRAMKALAAFDKACIMKKKPAKKKSAKKGKK
jgi:hypothetical protein